MRSASPLPRFGRSRHRPVEPSRPCDLADQTTSTLPPMFNIGGGEFMVIALIALIVLGPQRLPDAARQVGKAVGEIRRISAGFQNELKGAMNESAAATPAR